MPPHQLARSRRSFLAHVSLQQRAGVEICPPGAHQLLSRSSRSVCEIGPPFNGRGVHGGIGPAAPARRNNPARSSVRIVRRASGSARIGEMRAIGLPRSVSVTSSPARTALTIREKFWLASRNPIFIADPCRKNVATSLHYSIQTARAIMLSMFTRRLDEPASAFAREEYQEARPYSSATLSCNTQSRSACGIRAVCFSSSSCERGQVESLCG